jgi:two-component system, OmpR family, response regulator
MAALSVLVVDDAPDSAQSTADVLNLLGFHARAVLTPLDAIREAAADPPDVVIMDLSLPGECELAHLLQERTLGRPLLVAYTGLQGTEARAQAEGYDLHILKPIDPRQLADLVRDGVRGRPVPSTSLSW